jgi:hypothetical protein
MARTRGKRKQTRKAKAKKLEMTQRYLYYEFDVTSGTSADSFRVDLSAGLSALNRRLYRQGRNYHVANVSVIDSSGGLNSASFCTLPQTWTTHKAWKLMFDAWMDQRSRTLENAPSYVTGRWSDFKVWMDQQHLEEALADETHTKGGILPVASDDDLITGGEWEISDISTVINGAEYANYPLWMLGDHDYDNADLEKRGFGVCKALEEMLQQPPESPVLPGDFKNSIILSMNPSTGADMADDILKNISGDNDQPPYNKLAVIGASHTNTASETFRVRDVGWATGSKGISSLPAMGFAVPLGLLECRFEWGSTNPGKIGVAIELVPGSYKGVHAEAF